MPHRPDITSFYCERVGQLVFAAAGAYSSLGGQSKNPHDLSRSPAGSSGGTGVAIAAGYAPLGMGTDTGGANRGPPKANSNVGLETTHRLRGRKRVNALALSFGNGRPMARQGYELARGARGV